MDKDELWNKLNAIKYVVLAPAIIVGKACTSREQPVQPNIIYILTDQQSASMMSSAGNKWLHTPAMDYMAENGLRFTRAYTSNPVSSPARVSMMTGRMAGYFKANRGNTVRENAGAMHITELPEEVRETNIATVMRQAGYDLVFGGKQHLPKSLQPETLGFNVISMDERDELAETAAQYIKKEHAKPFFMIVSLINPHDICYKAIRHFASTEEEKRIITSGKTEVATLDEALKIPEGMSQEEFFETHWPPLPPHYEPQTGEPKAIDWLLHLRPFRINAREKYTDEDWRMHRWAYCRLTEVVDRQIQVILDALKESGQEKNTLVMLTSDHGDMNAAHRLEHKTVLYEESANIPFVVMWKGKISGGRVDSVHLVSNMLDLLPTASDYAGKAIYADLRGKSLRPLLEGKKTEWRKSLGVETEMGQMVVDENRCKYMKYDAVGIEEQLQDLKSDPYEMMNYINHPEYSNVLYNMRKQYGEWFPEDKLAIGLKKN
jgi:choline-sulfatase